MKKVLALTALIATSTAFSAETTSTKKIDVSKMSFKERASIAYFGILEKEKATEKKDNELSLTNYIIMDYKVTNKLKFNFTPIFSLNEGAGDEFAESDPRVMVKYSTYKSADEKLSISHRAFVDLPWSKGSQDSDKITKMRLYNITSYKIDDLNSVSMWNMFNKTFSTKASDSVSETSRHVIYNYISYSNKYLSEKYAFRVDYNADLEHISGAADTSFRNGDESFQVGVDTDIAGVSAFPYLSVATGAGDVVALDQAGLGVQMYKAF